MVDFCYLSLNWLAGFQPSTGVFQPQMLHVWIIYLHLVKMNTFKWKWLGKYSRPMEHGKGTFPPSPEFPQQDCHSCSTQCCVRRYHLLHLDLKHHTNCWWSSLPCLQQWWRKCSLTGKKLWKSIRLFFFHNPWGVEGLWFFVYLQWMVDCLFGKCR